MHSFPWMWAFVGLFFWLCFMRPGRLRACEGRWTGDQARASPDRARPRRARVERDDGIAERDALIARLEERVRVLERIATDDAARLRDEIDRLDDSGQR